MELLVDEAQVEAHFGCFGGSANFDVRWALGFATNVPLDRKSLSDGTPR